MLEIQGRKEDENTPDLSPFCSYLHPGFPYECPDSSPMASTGSLLCSHHTAPAFPEAAFLLTKLCWLCCGVSDSQKPCNALLGGEEGQSRGTVHFPPPWPIP